MNSSQRLAAVSILAIGTLTLAAHAAFATTSRTSHAPYPSHNFQAPGMGRIDYDEKTGKYIIYNETKDSRTIGALLYPEYPDHVNGRLNSAVFVPCTKEEHQCNGNPVKQPSKNVKLCMEIGVKKQGPPANLPDEDPRNYVGYNTNNPECFLPDSSE
ncbi:MAG: hypothetical protein ACRDRU_03020 [Pseudonocardiaceae bacterium]